MKKLSLILLLFILSFTTTLKADEGMWLLSLLKQQEKTMQDLGLSLTADQIYSINNSSVKDAIVGLGSEGAPFWHFCTAEIISDKGLILTNHHCGYGRIQSHSTPENNYLKNGFWAYTLEDEIPNPGMTASVLVRMEEVTKQVLQELNDDMTEEERDKKIREVSKTIEAEAVEGTHYNANVRGMFENNRFFLFVHVIYKDVRLTGAPPESMGKFGGDTDNWMWPRHTADFSMFRIYTAPDGSPAPYSEDNIPLKPKHHLPISIKGVKENDFAMILGFPGRTNRFLTSYGLKETMDITNKNRYEIRTVKLRAMKEYMDQDVKIRIQYASKHAGAANYWKYSNEQNKALKKLNTLENKVKIEADFTNWVNENDKRKEKYGNTLAMIENAYEGRKEQAFLRSYISEALLAGAEMPSLASNLGNFLISTLKKENLSEEDLNAAIARVKTGSEGFYKDYDYRVDKNMFIALNNFFIEKVNEEHHPAVFETIKKEFNMDIEKYADHFYKNSVFATKEKLDEFLKNPSLELIENDPAVEYGSSVRGKFREVAAAFNEKSVGLDRGNRLFVDGITQMDTENKLAPDANSTIRLTYGTVKGYAPRDAVKYKYYTTLKGVMEKEDPNDFEFHVPSKLKALYDTKSFGQYANENGELVTCFLTTNDITGGNSGSPVLNANGELIGIAFDGNSEAMSGDIDFEENLQRCINIDMRYTLFIIDEFAGAKNLIKEMTIVK